MKQRVTLITLGVDDLKKSLKFYRALGWKTQGIVGEEFENGAVVFFDLQKGLTLDLYERKNLAKDAEVELCPKSSSEFSLAYNVSSKKEVDILMQEAETAGAKITKKSQRAFWGGYHGYFADPDGHLWEIAYNPEMKTGE